jgi:hypothetical protein
LRSFFHCLPSSWNYRHVPPCLALIASFLKGGKPKYEISLSTIIYSIFSELFLMKEKGTKKAMTSPNLLACSLDSIVAFFFFFSAFFFSLGNDVNLYS